MALLMSALPDCAWCGMSARTLLSSIWILCSLQPSCAWFDEELCPRCAAPWARHLVTSAGRHPDWALMGANLWQDLFPPNLTVRGFLWNSTECSVAMGRLVSLGLALGGVHLLCVMWTCSPPPKHLLVGDTPCASGNLGWSAGAEGASWHPEWLSLPGKAAVLNRPPQGLHEGN